MLEFNHSFMYSFTQQTLAENLLWARWDYVWVLPTASQSGRGAHSCSTDISESPYLNNSTQKFLSPNWARGNYSYHQVILSFRKRITKELFLPPPFFPFRERAGAMGRSRGWGRETDSQAESVLTMEPDALDSVIMTWADTESQKLNWLSHLGVPRITKELF